MADALTHIHAAWHLSELGFTVELESHCDGRPYWNLSKESDLLGCYNTPKSVIKFGKRAIARNRYQINKDRMKREKEAQKSE